MPTDRVYEKVINLDAPGVSEWVYVDAEAFARKSRYRPHKLVLTIQPNLAGSGYYEFTTDTREGIDDLSANIEAWLPGEVSEYSRIVIKNLISAFRVVNTAGVIRAVVRGE